MNALRLTGMVCCSGGSSCSHRNVSPKHILLAGMRACGSFHQWDQVIMNQTQQHTCLVVPATISLFTEGTDLLGMRRSTRRDVAALRCPGPSGTTVG